MITYNRDKYNPVRIRRAIENVRERLGLYGAHKESTYGLYRIEKISKNRAMNMYRQTLEKSLKRRSLEPLSALWVDTSRYPAVLEWSTEKQEIGEAVTVTASAPIREELSDVVRAWEKAGFAFGSTGGIFTTIPNKSYEKMVKLHDHPEFLFPVIRMGMEDEWVTMWSEMISERCLKSIDMLELKETVPDIFSVGNKMAGTGVMINGLRRRREELDEIPPEQLAWLLDVEAGSAIMFAAAQIVDAGPGNVWNVITQSPEVKGAVGARSDGGILEAGFDGTYLTTRSKFTCRQIFANGGGVLCNSAGEAKVWGKSVSQMIWERMLELFQVTDKIFPPFRGMESLVEMWTTHTYDSGKPGDMIILGQDIGLSGTIGGIKAGADMLFSGSFSTIGDKTMPDLGSGAWYTMLSYIIYHVKWARSKVIHKAVALGDDFNTFGMWDKYKEILEVFYPYEKIKGTQGMKSKLLGFMTDRTDPIWKLFNTPRIQKSVSSATQSASEWKEILPEDVPDFGKLEIRIPPLADKAVLEALEVVKTLVLIEGTQDVLASKVAKAWNSASARLQDILEFLPSWMQQNYFHLY